MTNVKFRSPREACKATSTSPKPKPLVLADPTVSLSRESSPESGVALEVFGWEVPPPFAGFSTASAVRVIQARRPATSNNPTYYLQFVLADTATGSSPSGFPTSGDYTWDAVPPNFLKRNDLVVMSGRDFLLDDNTGLTNGVYTATNKTLFQCDFDQTTGSTLAFVTTYNDGSDEYRLTAPKRYKINRQPTTSAAPPYQLPAGIVIDMQASVAEGSDNAGIAGRFPTPISFFIEPVDRSTPSDTVGIMFSPTGAVSSVIFNGNELTSVSRTVIMLGRIENGGIDPTINLTATGNAPWTVQTGEKVEDVQKRINWLNLDSRLLSIVTSNGRTVVSEPAFVDPSLAINQGADDGATAEIQLEAAHGFAHEMNTAK